MGSEQLELSLGQWALTICQVSWSDRGPYWCKAKNPAITSLSEPMHLMLSVSAPLIPLASFRVTPQIPTLLAG